MEATPLTRCCLHAMKQQARYQITSHLHSSQAIPSRAISHFPARRKSYAARLISSNRPFSTSRCTLQDRPSQSPPASQYSPPSSPSTAPKPSIMGDLTKKLRTQSSDYVPDKRPLAEQLDIFTDIMDAMGSDPNKRPGRFPLAREDEGIDQEALYNNLAGTALRQSDEPRVSLRLKPALGRTQPLDLTRNVDLMMAFRKVERKCTDNNVKIDARNQRIYVRRGQRRKDDRRRRWRALFKEGFLHE